MSTQHHTLTSAASAAAAKSKNTGNNVSNGGSAQAAFSTPGGIKEETNSKVQKNIGELPVNENDVLNDLVNAQNQTWISK